MISKNKAKFILSLRRKKIRDEENLFVIEGDKLVREFLNAGMAIRILAAKAEFLSSLPDENLKLADEKITLSFDELKQISTLMTPHNAIAVVAKPYLPFDTDEIFTGLSVALDNLQDPGNLGTIIRAAAWFGIRNIVCSGESVDVYNSKVIQASMGAILHVNVSYADLSGFLADARKNELPVYGTMLEGDSIYDHKLGNRGIILLGNESRGVSENLIPYITDRLFIPGAGLSKPGIESLNVGMAASVVFSEFRRRAGSH